MGILSCAGPLSKVPMAVQIMVLADLGANRKIIERFYRLIRFFQMERLRFQLRFCIADVKNSIAHFFLNDLK